MFCSLATFRVSTTKNIIVDKNSQLLLWLKFKLKNVSQLFKNNIS